MSTFVLCPGAWLGAWVWHPVAEGLRDLGHEAYPLTLPGLAERAGEPVEKIGLSAHVADVRAFLEAEELHDVVLVGHSYAGIVTGQVAAAVPARVRHAVFVDANLPVDGMSMTDSLSERWREVESQQVEQSGGFWPPPDPEEFDGHDLTPEQTAWLLAHATGHPGQTLFDPATLARPLTSLTAAYIHCAKPEMWRSPDAEALRGAPGWSFAVLETGHWPMVSAPEALVRLLHEIASG
ncbi:MAG TPA: esterase [Micromonosporaceae bacterium]|nr:esterase [Micromonosporaceae bacterium]HCU51030.1 esterase [Micromonosporaceae bacterium]